MNALDGTPRVFPDYENPPVIEVVCGILFEELDQVLAPHFGLLWEKYRSEYPECREVPPLTPAIETFEGPISLGLRLENVPPLPRVWFIHADKNGIIQVQRDRFLHNWRKIRDTDEYPRYPQVIRLFKDRYNCFQSFLEENRLGEIRPKQYELTYVNHIRKGQAWEGLGCLRGLFPDFAWRSDRDRFLPDPSGVNWRTTFDMPERVGRLHVKIQNGKDRETGDEIIVLDLTVRGIGEDKSLEGMWEWFNTAREWIVFGFTDLTGEEVHKTVWKRRR